MGNKFFLISDYFFFFNYRYHQLFSNDNSRISHLLNSINYRLFFHIDLYVENFL